MVTQGLCGLSSKSAAIWLPICALASCQDTKATQPGTDAIISLSPFSATAPADGATLVALTAQLPGETRADRRQVVFSTSAGTLTEGTGRDAAVTADATGLASIALRAPSDPVVAQVRAVANGVVGLATVTFAPALAERLDVEPERLAVRATGTDEIRVNALLRRAVGRASAGAVVSFAAFDSAGVRIDQVLPTATSDATGLAVSRFNPGVTIYRGRVTLQATSAGAGSTPVLTGRVVVVIVP